MKNFLSIIILLFISTTLFAAVPEGRLFQFNRSKNANYICYDVNLLDNGKLDSKHPVTVYWIRAAEGGERKKLSFLQRTMAFGYKVISSGKDEATIHLTAYKELPIRVCHLRQKWVALVNVRNREVLLRKMYVKTVSPDSLKVEYVDVIGTDLESGKPVSHRISPDA